MDDRTPCEDLRAESVWGIDEFEVAEGGGFAALALTWGCTRGYKALERVRQMRRRIRE